MELRAEQNFADDDARRNAVAAAATIRQSRTYDDRENGSARSAAFHPGFGDGGERVAMRNFWFAIALCLVPSIAIAQASQRGDANADGTVNAADATFLASHLLGNGPAPIRACLADVNADGILTPADVFRLADYLFAAGTPPPAQPAEVCNGVDDDCDGVIDDGFDKMTDENNCGSCGTVCANAHGTTSCVSGACVPVCAFGYVSCDSNFNNGCETLLNTNPACGPGVQLLAISGDTGAPVRTYSGSGEARLSIPINETGNSCIYLSAQVTLTPAAGTDYDLYVSCTNCSGTTRASTSTGTESIVTWHGDSCFGEDSGYTLFIEVRLVSASTTACGNWTVSVIGNVAATTADLCCGDC